MRCCVVFGCLLLLPSFYQAADLTPQAVTGKWVHQAIQKGVDYLKSQEVAGNWEHLASGLALQYDGGTTCVVTLGLLEAGVKPDDPVMQRCLNYVRKLGTKRTYVVALQTELLAKANLPQDRQLLQRNVDWLLDTVKRNKQADIDGWSYPQIAPADNSNTHYAVMGLHAAAKAGIPIDKKVWEQIEAYYVRDQLPSGGWAYRSRNPAQERETMVCAGICSLAIVKQHRQLNFGAQGAIDKAWQHLGLIHGKSTNYFRFYNLHALRQAGERIDKPMFKDAQGNQIAWYRQGSKSLLVHQDKIGSWRGNNTYDGNPVVATSFALLFLANGEKWLK